MRPLRQLKAWARPAAEDPLLASIAGSANSPNSAYELAYIETGDAALSKSCRWLAMMKRDHGKSSFNRLVSSVSSNRPREERTGKKKGNSAMTKTDAKPEVRAAGIPLKGISYTASITGPFARVRCSQEFLNPNHDPVEAVYVFPLPDDSSVIKCHMQIGERRIEAELKKRADARREYERAVSQGHHGTLLEQERPNIFTMNVGGIEPGETVTAAVEYVQRVPWSTEGGRFRVPLVVPPQFIPGNPTGEQGVEWEDVVPDASRITPRVGRPDEVTYNADISILFSPGFRCKLHSPSHTFLSPMTVAKSETVEIKTGEIRTDRDFTLVFQSVSKVPAIAVHSCNYGGEGFILASIIPPQPESSPVPADIVLLLDCSGSMMGTSVSGLRIVSKKLLDNLSGQGHMVGILPFDSSVRQAYPIGPVTEQSCSFVEGLEAAGGTELRYALEEAANMLNAHESTRDKVIVLVTDGDTESGRSWRGNGIRLIALGIGSAVNDTRVNGLARCNNGVGDFVYPGEDYGSVAARLSGYVTGPVLSDVRAVCGGDAAGAGDAFMGRPATIAVRFGPGEPRNLSITGRLPDGSEKTWDLPKNGKKCEFAPQIWARESIREARLSDRQTEISLKYGVICQHTSFVAVSEKKVPGRQPVRMEIPVNLPDGWVFDAVFGRPMGFGAYGMPKAIMRGMRSDMLGYSCSADAQVVGDAFDMSDLDLSEPIIRKPGKRPSSRFTLANAADPADLLVAVLNAVLTNKRESARAAFRRADNDLYDCPMSDEKRMMAYYFALRLAKHGLRLSEPVMKELASTQPSSPIAISWYNLAMKELGKPFITAVPEDDEAGPYIRWKMGTGPRPESGPWASVL